jgi:hypothetical protein
MRVKNVYNNMKLEIKDGDNVIMSLKKPHVAPGEMEKVIIPKVILDKIQGKEIIVELVRGDE